MYVLAHNSDRSRLAALAGGLAALALGLLAHTAFAADFTASPVIIDEKGNPRDIIKETVILTNTANHLLTIYATTNNITDSGMQPSFQPTVADDSTSLANWIEITRGEIDLMPSETRKISFLIHVDLTAKAGTYHAAISFDTKPGLTGTLKSADDAQVVVNFTVNSGAVEHLELANFSSAASVVLSGAQGFTYNLTNNGNEPITPRGDIRVYDRQGREVADLPANDKNIVVDPSVTKRFDVAWDDIGIAAVGRYKAYLDLSYGDNGSGTLNDTVYFWVMSWQHLTVLLFTVIGTVLTGVIFMYWRRATREMSYVVARQQMALARVSRDASPRARGSAASRWEALQAERAARAEAPADPAPSLPLIPATPMAHSEKLPAQRSAIYDEMPAPASPPAHVAEPPRPLSPHEHLKNIRRRVAEHGGYKVTLSKRSAPPHPDHVLAVPKHEPERPPIDPAHVVDLKAQHKKHTVDLKSEHHQ